MHGDIRAMFMKRDLELFDEQPFATDFRERAIEHAIALGRHRHKHDFETWMCLAEP
jgi:hypothetical protein